MSITTRSPAHETLDDVDLAQSRELLMYFSRQSASWTVCTLLL